MPLTVDLPTNATIEKIMQNIIPLLTEDDEAFRLFPTENENASMVMWENLDNYTGLMSVRGLNGEPVKVQGVGSKRYQMEPGYFANYVEIDEKEATERRELGSFGDKIVLDNLIGDRLNQLASMRINLQRKMVWDMLTAGRFTSTFADGTIGYTDAYTRQTYTISIPWSTVADAVPLLNFRTAIQQSMTGQSVSFNQEAKAYMNLKTLNHMLNNTNASDLFGKRTDFGATFNSIVDVNKVLAANDLPQIEVYNEGYYPLGTTVFTPANFVNFIPDGGVVIVGKRKDKAPIGKVSMTANLYNEGGYGPYTIINQSINTQQQPVPFRVTITDGFNGGIKLFYPSAIIYMS